MDTGAAVLKATCSTTSGTSAWVSYTTALFISKYKNSFRLVHPDCSLPKYVPCSPDVLSWTPVPSFSKTTYQSFTYFLRFLEYKYIKRVFPFLWKFNPVLAVVRSCEKEMWSHVPCDLFYISIYIYIYISIYLYIYRYIDISIYIYVYICICIYICVCVCVCTHTHTHMLS